VILAEPTDLEMLIDEAVTVDVIGCQVGQVLVSDSPALKSRNCLVKRTEAHFLLS
jgi:hypothetical protein